LPDSRVRVTGTAERTYDGAEVYQNNLLDDACELGVQT
jgi:hypothetical protein